MRKYETDEEREAARKASVRKYKKKAFVQFGLKLHVVNDAAVIGKLNSVPNRNGYIRKLILKDIGEGR